MSRKKKNTGTNRAVDDASAEVLAPAPCESTLPNGIDSLARQFSSSLSSASPFTSPNTGLSPTVKSAIDYPKKPYTLEHHGDAVEDPYHWLQDRSNPQVKRLLKEENKRVEHFFKTYGSKNSTSCARSVGKEGSQLTGLRKTLFKEMRARAKEEDASLPARDRHYWYYTRQVRNAEYPLYCRRPYTEATRDFVHEMSGIWRADPTAPLPDYDDEMCFLDVNLLAQELKVGFIDIGDMDVSPDETHVAVTVDLSNGGEVFTVLVLPIVNVDYRAWLKLGGGASERQRAWAREMTRQDKSIYDSPTTALTANVNGSSLHGSPTSSYSGHSPVGGGYTRAKKQFPSAPLLSQKATTTTATTAGATTSSPTTAIASPTNLNTPRPHHTIEHTISMFDISTEVLWLNDSSLLYTALDEKLRPHQLVYHDLTRADTDSAATVVCFEEEDEAFWLGNIGFTADEKYLIFGTASTDVSEWYVSPACGCRTDDSSNAPAELVGGMRRNYKGIPLVPSHMCDRISKENCPVTTTLDPPQKQAPVTCFSTRQNSPAPREYDIDHHRSLLSPTEGAWVVISNLNHCDNFAIFCFPDAETETISVPHAGEREEDGALRECSREDLTARSRTSAWLPLFDYDPRIKVEGVECYSEVLLISVRKHGARTVLMCPVTEVWTWWESVGTAQLAASAPSSLSITSPTLRLASLVDLSLVYQGLLCTSDGAAAASSDEVVLSFSQASMLAARGAAESTSHRLPSFCQLLSQEERQQQQQKLDEDEDGTFTASSISARSPDLTKNAPRVESLPWFIECFAPSTTAFDTNAWRVMVTHLLYPCAQYKAKFIASSGDNSGSASLRLQKIRQEMVNGPHAYLPEEYDGAVLWVPSGYAFTRSNNASETSSTTAGDNTVLALQPVDTKEPMEATLVPVSLCWHRSLFNRMQGDCPLVLHVYGSYGDCSDPEFCSERLSLLDRGFVWGSAAVRGGGELGIPWRDAGRVKQRGTAINDFLSVSQYVQDVGVCGRGRLIASGGSAGGLVVMRAMNQAPHLYHAIIGAAPFVDCLASLLDEAMPLTITEWEEFGNPIQDPEAYALVKALSPMNTIPQPHVNGNNSSVVFPHVLLETSWRDSRVGFWESLKLTARLREVWQQGSAQAHRELLHFCEFEGGHGGATGRYQQLREIALEYAFAILVATRAGVLPRLEPSSVA